MVVQNLTPLSSGYDFMGMVINICCGKVPDFTKVGKPKIAEIHYIMCQEDLIKFENLKKKIQKSFGVLVK